MSTDWRALCAELADALDHNRQCLLDDRSLTHPLADKTRAALAQPDPEVVGPTDEELLALVPQGSESDFYLPQGLPSNWIDGDFIAPPEAVLAFARAVLARWGRPAPAPAEERQAAPVPVAVSERLPGPEDLDDQRRCWWLAPETDTKCGCWCLGLGTCLPPEGFGETHWLPAHALPLPSGEGDHG